MDDEGKAVTSKTIDIINRKLVETNIIKKVYQVTSDGKLEEITKDQTIHLYYSEAWVSSGANAGPSGTIYEYSTTTHDVDKTYDAADNWTDIPIYQPSHADPTVVTRRYFLVKEDDLPETYYLDGTATGNTYVRDTITYVYLPQANLTGASSTLIDVPGGSNKTIYTADLPLMPQVQKVLYNVQDLRVIRIWKRDYYTNVPLTGDDAVTVSVLKNADGTAATLYDPATCQALTGNTVTVSQGDSTSPTYATVYVKPGDYKFAEDTAHLPAGYSYHSTTLINTYNNKDTDYSSQGHLNLNSHQTIEQATEKAIGKLCKR